MAKTDNRKLLLAYLSTDRDVKIAGTDKTESRRVRFKPGQVVDLTKDELDLLIGLEKSTGVAHFREPIREGSADLAAEEPEVVDVPDYLGQDTPIATKTAAQLKAFLDFHSVTYAGNASAETLRTAATTKQAELDNPAPAGTDLDGGL